MFGKLRIDGETEIVKEGSIPRPMWRIGVAKREGRCAVAAQTPFLNPQNPGDLGQPTPA